MRMSRRRSLHYTTPGADRRRRRRRQGREDEAAYRSLEAMLLLCSGV